MRNKTISFPNLMLHGVISLACALWIAAPARAASVVPLYLDEIADTAAVVFEGTCTGNRTERDPQTGYVVTFTTFAVHDAIKGGAGASYTIKQIGGSLPGEELQYRVQGVPAFTVGETYVVFLAGVSSLGFSSPIGLAQGRFRVAGAPAAQKVANGRDFKELTARIASRVPAHARALMQEAAGPALEMDLADFKQTVRGHLGGVR